jgi:hypothetical protein
VCIFSLVRTHNSFSDGAYDSELQAVCNPENKMELSQSLRNVSRCVCWLKRELAIGLHYQGGTCRIENFRILLVPFKYSFDMDSSRMWNIRSWCDGIEEIDAAIEKLSGNFQKGERWEFQLRHGSALEGRMRK